MHKKSECLWLILVSKYENFDGVTFKTQNSKIHERLIFKVNAIFLSFSVFDINFLFGAVGGGGFKYDIQQSDIAFWTVSCAHALYPTPANAK